MIPQKYPHLQYVFSVRLIYLRKINDKFEEVKNAIEKMHSYEIPYIAKIKLEELNKKYADWSLNYMDW